MHHIPQVVVIDSLVLFHSFVKLTPRYHFVTQLLLLERLCVHYFMLALLPHQQHFILFLILSHFLACFDCLLPYNFTE